METSDAPSMFSPAEIEFLAENELVKIVPNFRMDALHFISGDYGPFRPQRPVDVPLWLATTLKTRQRCKIQPPEWLDADYLRDAVERERSDERYFSPMPFHYMEVALMLLECASDDMRQPAVIRTLLQDLRDLRLSKARSSIHQFEGPLPAIQMDNLSLMEINEMRPFLVRVLDELHQMNKDRPELTEDRDELAI